MKRAAFVSLDLFYYTVYFQKEQPNNALHTEGNQETVNIILLKMGDDWL